MSALPVTYLEIVGPLIDTAREILERGESLSPFAFVGNLTTGETFPVLLSTATDEEKDGAAAMIRRLAELHEADFIFMIMEAWSLPPSKVGQFREIIEEYGSIGASPYRIDVASFALETRHGLWVTQIPIEPKDASETQRTFGRPQFQHFTDAKGRFVDLLPVKDGERAAHRTLH
ncbi:hypothetical protein [Thiocapsa marina]|uniref:Uncharacterized protein n=1 Tax=Thiocapsa marina 5811 TaxID=768671 RepID=F9UGE5_9GAMM|nr:hypothetical protein [Thiocapsa marina]EGV16628.1 hypothetical protein ThimaDRAFT_3998 [Thiocapsa marina 5811]